MRIVLDLQGKQSADALNRGISRYILAFTQALIQESNHCHDIIITLSGSCIETVEQIRKLFKHILPEEKIRFWFPANTINYLNNENAWDRQVAELTREAFLISLNPDIIILTNIFDGLDNEVATSIGMLNQSIYTIALTYDLIPIISRHLYLNTGNLQSWYLNKLYQLKRANLVLATTNSAYQEALHHLELPQAKLEKLPLGTSPAFHPLSKEQKSALSGQLNISRPFILYSGDVGHLKPIENLIIAYAKLPSNLREKYQLIIALSTLPNTIEKSIWEISLKHLKPQELQLTTYTTDTDLNHLYNLCQLFIFSPIYENFSLPVLEAIKAGAVVIASNIPSLQELLPKEALFDPNNVSDISEKILHTLTDQLTRSQLLAANKKTSNNTNINIAAQHLLHIINLQFTKDIHPNNHEIQIKRQKLAYVIEENCITDDLNDYHASLLPALSLYYDIEIVSDQEHINNLWIDANCNIRTLQWFQENGPNFYDRTLYHLNKSTIHSQVFYLIKIIPGLVVLHDLLSLHTDNQKSLQSDRIDTVLYNAPKNSNSLNLDTLIQTGNIITHIIGLPELIKREYQTSESSLFKYIPLPKMVWPQNSGVGKKYISTYCFINHDAHKKACLVLNSWCHSILAAEKNNQLIFVMPIENNPTMKEKLIEIASKFNLDKQIDFITDVFCREQNTYCLDPTDISVHLDCEDEHKHLSALLDCLKQGIATITNAALPANNAWVLPPSFNDTNLTEAFNALSDNFLREKIGNTAREFIIKNHQPKISAKLYFETIENAYKKSLGPFLLHDLIKNINNLHTKSDKNKHKKLLAVAHGIEKSILPHIYQAQLFVDISAIVLHDLKTGIQRVVRSILAQLINNPPKYFRVEPVYASKEGYHYARQFTSKLHAHVSEKVKDTPIEYRRGDIFLGLDFVCDITIERKNLYKKMRQCGVSIHFIVYDLLPIELPEFFPPVTFSRHCDWIEVISENNSAICISKAVATNLQSWINKNHTQANAWIDWFHLGADIENSIPSTGIPENADFILKKISTHKSFLMVSTIEPRKGHNQTLEAFEQLWSKNHDIILVIIGKKGWMMESFIEKIQSHPELNKRLYWMDGISDEYVEKIYAVCSCLIAASLAEGFGLPLVEAAQHKLPIIARNIPVFKEIAGSHAYYFNGHTPEELALSIMDWLDLESRGMAPKSDNLPWLTWKESTEQLISALFRHKKTHQEKKNLCVY